MVLEFSNKWCQISVGSVKNILKNIVSKLILPLELKSKSMYL